MLRLASFYRRAPVAIAIAPRPVMMSVANLSTNRIVKMPKDAAAPRKRTTDGKKKKKGRWLFDDLYLWLNRDGHLFYHPLLQNHFNF